jgi:twitching motility protein PilT
MADYPNGLVLVTGMAGSGKSTTLASIVDHVNRSRARHVITLEDPIEYAHPSRLALVHQREIGRDVTDFASGLRAALRESPDIILLGEMRDRETIAAALTAAETGHLVLSTLHASNAMVAIDRVIDIFPADHQRQIRLQLSIVLREVLTQYLLPNVAGDARVPAYERMIKNDAIASHIRDDKTHQIPSAIQTGRAEGMVPLELSLARLVRAGHLTRTAAQAMAREPGYLAELLRG